ncbi:MAG TPA: rhomboid family intramembrane serine protease [Chthoniobacter sp.]|nr:rhomboid family intramembrane serine protease [Chthoniobacter sp.]
MLPSSPAPGSPGNLSSVTEQALMTERPGTRPPQAPLKPRTPVSFRKRIVTIVIIAISVVWTAWIFFASSPGSDWRPFGVSNGYQVYLGDYWTLFTSMFVHVNALHLYFNAYWIWILGGWVEERYGARFYALLVVISGFCASALELSFAGGTGVGLSGVVYAIFGLLWGAQLFGSHSTDEVLPAQRIQLFLVWLVLCFVLTATGALSIGNVAHVTGLVVGVLAAFAVASPQRVIARVAVPLAVLVSGITVLYSPWSFVWLGSKAIRAQMSGQFDVAVHYYSAVIERRPNDPWPLENRGRIQVFLGHTAEGKADIDRAELERKAPGQIPHF